MKNTIEVKVTTKHFKNATQYIDNGGCPLALAVKDVFPDATCISVYRGSVNVWIKDNKHTFNVTYKWRTCQEIYGGQFKGICIDAMILLAKGGKRIPTKILVLDK